MKTLGIEGALGGFSAAVAHDGAVMAHTALEGNIALEGGLGAIQSVLQSARLAVSALDRIAVGIGPGGFTGLRITIAYAKSLAQAWSLPLAGVSSFDALEYGTQLERVLTVVVGRTGVISARFRAPGIERRDSGLSPAVLKAVLADEEPGLLPVIGAPEDALAALAEAGFTVKSVLAKIMPPAAAVALAGSALPAAASLHEVRADYGEAPAAKVPQF